MKWDISKQIGKRITIKTKSGVLFFDVERIKYIICDGRHCFVHLIDESEHRVRRPLKFFEQELEKFGFPHVNGNTLVNARYIKGGQFSSTKRTLHVKVTKTEAIIVSRRKVATFKTAPEA